MALYPKAKLDLIPPGENDPKIIPDGSVKHVAVSNATSLKARFTDGSGIEAHFYVLKDGTVIQYRDTDYEADAQFDGNSYYRDGKRYGKISIETQGGVGADLGQPWTVEQIASMKDLDIWLAQTHGYALQEARGWNQTGNGYHAKFLQWNKDHHSCPGQARINQYEAVFVPWYATHPEVVKPKPNSRGKRVDEIIRKLRHARAQNNSQRQNLLKSALDSLLKIKKTFYKK